MASNEHKQTEIQENTVEETVQEETTTEQQAPKNETQSEETTDKPLSAKENEMAQDSPLLSSDEIEEQEHTSTPGEEFFDESTHEEESAQFENEMSMPDQGNQALAGMLASGYSQITPQILLAIFSPRAVQMQQLDAETRAEVEGIKQMFGNSITIDADTEKGIQMAIANYLKTVNFTAPTPLQGLIMALAMPLMGSLFVGFQMKSSMDELIRTAKKKKSETVEGQTEAPTTEKMAA